MKDWFQAQVKEQQVHPAEPLGAAVEDGAVVPLETTVEAVVPLEVVHLYNIMTNTEIILNKR